MTKTLDVLVLGGRSSEEAAEVLERRGHRTHRCHPIDGPAFPCVGLADPSSCPLEGQIDVALLVRRGIQPQPLPEEEGVRCALRAGVPVVEDGLDVHDPYAKWITARVGIERDLAAECVAAADRGYDTLRSLIRERIGRLVGVVGVDPDDVSCHIDAEPRGLRVDLAVPAPIERPLQHAIAVRVLDAVRAGGRNRGQVSVDVRGTNA